MLLLLLYLKEQSQIEWDTVKHLRRVCHINRSGWEEETLIIMFHWWGRNQSTERWHDLIKITKEVCGRKALKWDSWSPLLTWPSLPSLRCYKIYPSSLSKKNIYVDMSSHTDCIELIFVVNFRKWHWGCSWKPPCTWHFHKQLKLFLYSEVPPILVAITIKRIPKMNG